MEDDNRGGDRATVDPIGQVSAPAMITVDDGGAGKKKRGRPPRGHAAVTATAKKKVEVEEEGEDVCFICFDGGSLVLCDRRGCPKAYHPACIKRDEAFFQSKAKWNCGWHICSICQKAAHHRCYTCTYSLCKTCAKDADYLSVRENKGLCVTCMKTIMLIENNVPDNKDMVQVDFDDKSSWEYLFKVYWVYLKEKLSLTLDELIQAKKPCSEVVPIARKEQKLDVIRSISDCKSSISDVPSQHVEICGSKKRKIKKQLILPNIEEDQSLKKTKIKGHRADISSDKSSTLSASAEWATKELFEFVAHMRNGDISVLSQFEVQSLLLEYIKKNNLRDPHRKSQIICDARLTTLFLKPRVGHFEMLKLLEYHFLIKEDNQKDDILGNTVRAVPNQVEGGGNNESLLLTDKDKKRKFRKKGEVKGPQTNLDEFAAIDVHNINLIYLRRNLMENLVTTNGKFYDKVVGSVVRIRISGGDPKQDIYRLVQVIGTFKAAVPYKVGGKTVDVMLKILNLNKKELVAIDAISNQNFSEDECRRLRQSVKCGLVKQMTVGQVQEKAKALQEVRLNDWLETEILRLNHLRDRASENGRKKELRECVEKIELLKSPEERQRRLHETPQVHPDQKMDPKCESDTAAGEISKRKQADPVKQRSSEFRKLGRDLVSIQNKNKQAKFSLGKGPSSRLGKQVHELHKRKEACVSKNPPVSLSNGSTPTEYKSETEKLWHYRDPNGNIQGPFCLLQLRKWSTSGYFPPDMRVWSINTDELDSLLLADVMNGNFNGALASRSNTSLPYQDKLFICEDRHSSTVNPTIVNDGKRSNGSWNCSSATSVHQMTVHEDKRWISGPTSENISSQKTTLHPNAGHDSQSDNRPFSGQSSVESWRPLAVNITSNNSDSNSNLASVPKSTDSSDHLKINALNLPSPTPVATNNGHLENDTSKDRKPSQSCAPIQDLGMEELPSPTPKPSDRDEKASLGIRNLPSPSPTMIDTDEKVDSSIGDSPSSLPNERERDEKVQATKSNPPCTNQTSTSSTPTPSDINEKSDLFAKNLRCPSSKIVDEDEKVDSTVQNLPYSAPSFTCDSITPKPSDEKAGIGIQNISGPSLMMVDDGEKVDSAIERLPSSPLNPGNGNKIVQAIESKPPGTNLNFTSSTPKPNDRDEKADTCILSSPSRKTDDEDRTVDSISQCSPSPSPNSSDGNKKVQTDEIKPPGTNLTYTSSIAKPKDIDEKADTCILSSPSPKKVDDDRRVDLTIQHTPSSSPNPSNESKKVQGNESKPSGTNLTFISSTAKSKDVDEKAATCILSSPSPKTNDEDRKVDPNLQTLLSFPRGPCNSNEKVQANENKQLDTCLTCTSSSPKPSDSDEKAAMDIQNIPNPLSKTFDEDVKVDSTVQSSSTLTDENGKVWANENKPSGTSLTCSSSQPEPNYKKEETGIDIQNFVSASAMMVDKDENPGSVNQNLSTSPIYPKDRNEKAQARESKPPDSSLICVPSTAELSGRDEKANIVIQNLLSPKVVNGNEKVDLTSCPPNTISRLEEVEAKESNPPNTRLSSNSALVKCFGSHEKIANEKSPEVFSDQGVIPSPNCEQFAPSTSNHPCTTLNWESFDYEPIEFSTLAEESVSDLLAEVDAMEAQGDVASPTTVMFSGDDFFEDHLFDFGTTGAVSSTGDSSSLPHQPAIVCEPLSISDYDIYDPTKRSIGEASTSSQAKTGPDNQNNWGNIEGGINPGFGGLIQGMNYMGWESNPDLAQVNIDMKQYSSFGFMGHERQSDPKGR